MYDLLEQVNSERCRIIEQFVAESRAYLLEQIRIDPTATTIAINLPYPSKEVAEVVAQHFNREGIITVTAHTYVPLSYMPSWSGRYYLICTVRSNNQMIIRPSYADSDSD